MTVWDYFKHIVANAGNGNGRASRTEYALMFIILNIVMFGPWLVSNAIESPDDAVWWHYLHVAGLGLSLACFIPLISLASRRCHDLGWSGWWAIINPWPLLLILPGQSQTNQHGPPPRAETGNYSSADGRTFGKAIRDGLNSFYWLS